MVQSKSITYFQDYGGIDIILIKLKQHAKGIKPACLPSPNYKDTNIKAIIAGYGKNRRAPCQVGSKGPSKYRYCGIEDACHNFETEKFKEANCSVTFTYKVRKIFDHRHDSLKVFFIKQNLQDVAC